MVGAALLSLVLLGTLGGFFFGWPLAVAYRLWSGRPTPSAPIEGEGWTAADVLREGWHRFWTGRFLPWTPRRHVPWVWFDMAVIGLPVAAIMLLPLLVGDPAKKVANPQPLKPEQLQTLVLMDTGVKVFFVVMATGYLLLRAKATPRDLGFSWRELGQNVLIGLVAFPLIAVPVYALQAAIVWYGKWAYEHPVIEMLQKTPDFGLFVLLALSACVIAPLSEEWFFRVVFQGWLQRGFAWLGRQFDGQEVSRQDIEVVVASPAGNDELNPYAAPAAVQPYEPVAPPEQFVEDAREAPFPHSILVQWVPILFSSVLFGLAHWGHGPAPITLTVLALALGYLYQRTHSIVPVIVVHSLFNSVSMLVFYVTMFEFHKPLP
ncbi:MAG TPA: CPBP family intramembrane glutamic endopeptidase [Pirellulaceae bacterium]|nr:CPBP family intramembrane glutamic endopeptidase [Pirellulaceae bacterium]